MDGDDAWERDDWEPSGTDVDREELLRLARHLAGQRERLRAEELAELEELKRALRERVAQVAARELEVQRREAELETGAAQERVARRGLRFRRDRPHVDEADRAYAEELLGRREADVARRTAELVPRERKLQELELTLQRRADELDVRTRAHEDDRAQLVDRERALAQRESEVEKQRVSLDQRRSELEDLHAGAARATAEHTARAATIAAREEAVAARDRQVAQHERDLENRARELDEQVRQAAAETDADGLSAERSALERRVRDLDDELAASEARLKAREQQVAAREADVVRAQGALAAREEELRRREREQDDAERMRERLALRPAEPFVSFSEGLDALVGRSAPPRRP